MTRDPATIRPATSIPDAAAEMARRGFRHLVVTDRSGAARILGIVSLHDLARAYPPDVNPLSAGCSQGPRRAVAEIMSRDPVTVASDAPIEEAARLMMRGRFGALPVVHNEMLVGIITRSDLLRAFVELAGGDAASEVAGAAAGSEAASGGVRVTFDVSDSEDAVAFVLELTRGRRMYVASVLTMRHQGKHLAVARLVGGAADADAFVDALWRSGRRVLSILRS